jgi:hypothetical protein
MAGSSPFANGKPRIDQHSSELERITSDVSRMTVERDAIGRTTGVVTDEDAGRIRTAREQAWAEHRRALDAASADRFEAALRRDDLVASGRFMHATELANLHRTSQELAVREEECRRVTELLKQATEEEKALLGEVATTVGKMSLPTDMSLAQVEAWLTRRNRTLEAMRLDVHFWARTINSSIGILLGSRASAPTGRRKTSHPDGSTSFGQTNTPALSLVRLQLAYSGASRPGIPISCRPLIPI